MAIPVIFTAEMFPLHELKGTMLTDAVIALNSELAAFFSEKVELTPPIPSDRSNLVRAEKCFSTNPAVEGQVWVQGSVAVGFNISDLDQARELAQTFTSKAFPQIMVDVLDPATPVDASKPLVIPSVERQVAEQLAKYGSAEERQARASTP